MRLTTALALCVSVSVPVSLAQTNRIAVSGYPTARTVALSLDDAVKIAVEHNLELQIQRYNPAIVGYQVQSAYGTYYDPVFATGWQRSDRTTEGSFNESIGVQTPPSSSQIDTTSASLGGNLPTGMRYDLYGNLRENNFRNFSDITGFNEQNDWSGDAGIRVSQPLLRNFWIDSGRRAIQEGKVQRKIADLQTEVVAQRIVADTARAYFQLLGARDAVAVAEADLQFNQQNYDEMRRRVQAGQRAAIDETKTLAEVAASRTRLVTAANAASDAEATLKGLLSDNYINQVGATIMPTEKLLLVPAMLDFPTSVRAALERRPNVLVAREQVERQNITLKYTYNQLFPALDIFAAWGVTGTDPHMGGVFDDLRKERYQNDGYGAVLTVPLTMWAERNNHKAAKLTKQQLLWNLKLIEEGVVKEVDDAIRAVLTNWELAQLTRDQVISAEADVEAQQRTMAAGKATSLEVLDAQRRLTEARNAQIQAIVDYNVALSELARAEGRALEERKIDFETAHRLRSSDLR
jgi:outer membrane protein